MAERMVVYTMTDGQEGMTVFSSFLRLLIWFIKRARRCAYISVRRIPPVDHEEVKEDPCETCLRWEECNGVDWGNCSKY